jgi:hypothetical protein
MQAYRVALSVGPARLLLTACGGGSASGYPNFLGQLRIAQTTIHPVPDRPLSTRRKSAASTVIARSRARTDETRFRSKIATLLAR